MFCNESATSQRRCEIIHLETQVLQAVVSRDKGLSDGQERRNSNIVG